MQPPESGSHASQVGQIVGVPPAQVPATQCSPAVQASASLQGAELGTPQVPVALQTSSVHAFPSSLQGVPSGCTPLSVQAPLPSQVSWFVHSVPASPQGEPAPANWQAAVQHAPPSQASPDSIEPFPHEGAIEVVVVLEEVVVVEVLTDEEVVELIDDEVELVEVDEDVVVGGGAEMLAHRQAALS
jgi:hypothetical protein